MKTLMDSIHIILAALGGILGWFLDGLDGFFYALIAFVIVDYTTGLISAVVNKQLSSEVGFRGILEGAHFSAGRRRQRDRLINHW